MKKTEELPTPAAMKKFAKRFKNDEWDFLCGDLVFVNLVSENISAARIMAEKILAKK